MLILAFQGPRWPPGGSWRAIGCQMVDTTCGDVMSVWKRVRQYSRTASPASSTARPIRDQGDDLPTTAYGTGHYLVVFDLETDYVCRYILEGGDKEEFLTKFRGAIPRFDPSIHLRAVGVANQTTMLRAKPKRCNVGFSAAMESKFCGAQLGEHFRVLTRFAGHSGPAGCLGENAQGADGSSDCCRRLQFLNTSHLAEMGEKVLPTHFIKNAAKMESGTLIRHWNQHINRRWKPVTGFPWNAR